MIYSLVLLFVIELTEVLLVLILGILCHRKLGSFPILPHRRLLDSQKRRREEGHLESGKERREEGVLVQLGG